MKHQKAGAMRNERCCSSIREPLLLLFIIMAVSLYVTAGAWAAPFAYVTIRFSDSVSVIDTATNEVSDTVAVGDLPAGVTINPNGAFAYVTNFSGNSVSVIDISSNAVVSTLQVGVGPNRPAITPDGTRVYVPNGTSDNVSVIDTSNNTVTDTLTVGDDPRHIAITPDGTTAYVINTGSGAVSVIDTNPLSGSFHTVIDTIDIGGRGPLGIAITPDGSRAYVSHRFDDSGEVAVIDTNPSSPYFHTVIADIPVEALTGGNLTRVAITPDGTRVYVLSNQSSSIHVINTADDTLNTTLPGIVAEPQGIAFTSDGMRAYVTSTFSAVKVIDTNPASGSFHTVIASVALPSGPSGVAVTPPAAIDEPSVIPTMSSTTPGQGDTVCVQVDIANISDLYAVSFDLSYNPSVLDYTGTTEGTFLSENGLVSTTLQAAALDGDESSGQIVVGVSRLGDVPGISGSGTLATLCFTVIGSHCSTSDIIFDNATLEGPSEGSEIAAIWDEGTLTVTLGAPMNPLTSDPGLHNRIDLCWDAVAGATAYDIYRSNNAGGPYTQIGTTTTTCYEDAACIIPTLHYYYRVQATTNDGSCVSEYSEEVLGVAAGLLGDINNDGRVNGRDLSILARAFGSSCDGSKYNCLVDLNRDCLIDGDDLSILAINFGMRL